MPIIRIMFVVGKKGNVENLIRLRSARQRRNVMLKEVRVFVLGVLMAWVLGYVCTGIITTPVLANEGCQKSSPSCCANKQGAPCDLTKELGLTPEQQAKIEKLKAECEKNGQKCTPECIQKVKEILTKEQGEKLDVLVAKMKNGGSASAPACKGEDAPQAK